MATQKRRKTPRPDGFFEAAVSAPPLDPLLANSEPTEIAADEGARKADFAVIDRTREAFKDVPADELEAEVTKAVAEARAQLRAEREQTETAAQETAREADSKPRKLETPQEFYARITKRPGIRELLTRLAKK